MLNEIFKGMDNAAEMINGNFEKLDVEVGENENGTWVIFNSGLQICFQNIVLPYENSTRLSRRWTYPKPFGSKVVTFISREAEVGVDAARFATYGINPELESALVRGYAQTDKNFQSSDSANVSVLAIGMRE